MYRRSLYGNLSTSRVQENGVANEQQQPNSFVDPNDDWQPVPSNRAHVMAANFNWSLAALDAKIPLNKSSSSAHRLDWASVGTADTIGRRSEMEDVVIAQNSTLYNAGGGGSGIAKNNNLHDSFYDKDAVAHRVWLCAVCDGHGGNEASAFVGARWPKMLFDVLSIVREPLTHAKIKHAIQTSLRQCNTALERALLGAPDVGTTLCAVLVIDGRTLYCINVGDSRCVAVRANDGAYKALSRDHKPSRPDELQRITRLGGSVLMCDGVARVGGNLSLSRALGDFGSTPYISGEAEISGPHDATEIGAVALVCDGVTDVLGDSQIAALVGALTPLKGAQHAAQALRDAAYVFGSGDNISAVVLNLAASPE
jgi:serine/threonine protein phosphatase PrpC